MRSSYHARAGAEPRPTRRRSDASARCPDGPRRFDAITPELTEFLEAQPVFFVATAPASTDGHVNLSPKGLDSFRVLDAHTVAYLDLHGSGIETVAHLRENGRITLMFCAFSGRPQIIRLYGRGTVIPADAPEAGPLPRAAPVAAGRALGDLGRRDPHLVVVRLRRAADGARRRPRPAHDWAEKKGEDGLAEYRAKKNATSINGLPGWG